MTVIVGISDKTGTWLAADTRISAGNSLVGTYRKIYRPTSNICYGVCGMLRDLNILQHIFKPPAFEGNVKSKDDCAEYLVMNFIPALITSLTEHGRVSEDDETFMCGVWQGSMLVAVGGHLFTIFQDFAMLNVAPYSSIGSGSELALGALSSSNGQSGEERCKLAIQAASKFDSSCNNSIEIIKMC